MATRGGRGAKASGVGSKERESRGFVADFKQFFGRGLAILLPTILTLALLWYAATFVFNNVAEPINRGVRMAVVFVIPRIYEPGSEPELFRVTPEQVRARLLQAGNLPADAVQAERALALRTPTIVYDIRRERLREYWRSRWYLNGSGLAIAILLIYLAGLLLSNFLGRKIYHYFEHLIAKIPGFKQIYPSIKQVVDLVLGENKSMAFKRVVLVEYPGPDLWTLGLVTGPSMKAVRDQEGGASVVSVFIPTSPTPMTGFVISVAESRIVETDITVDQAIRFVVTAGVLSPDQMAKDAAGVPIVDPRGDVVGQLEKRGSEGVGGAVDGARDPSPRSDRGGGYAPRTGRDG